MDENGVNPNNEDEFLDKKIALELSKQPADEDGKFVRCLVRN